MTRDYIDPHDLEALRRASDDLNLAAGVAADNGDHLLSAVFKQWAFAASFGDSINRVGGLETLALARDYLENN